MLLIVYVGDRTAYGGLVICGGVCLSTLTAQSGHEDALRCGRRLGCGVSGLRRENSRREPIFATCHWVLISGTVTAIQSIHSRFVATLTHIEYASFTSFNMFVVKSRE